MFFFTSLCDQAENLGLLGPNPPTFAQLFNDAMRPSLAGCGTAGAQPGKFEINRKRLVPIP